MRRPHLYASSPSQHSTLYGLFSPAIIPLPASVSILCSRLSIYALLFYIMCFLLANCTPSAEHRFVSL